MPAGDLSGRVVAITGASSGIGEAVALACAEAGAGVALAARRAERIQALADRIERDGGRAVAIPTDVAIEGEAAAFVEGARDRLGRLDGLVNDAGLMLLGPVASSPSDEWRRMVDVNVMGVLYCTQAALPIMRAQGGGHIVNLSSVAGRRTWAGSAVYSLTKFGVGAFSEALRQEVADDNIRVSVVEPGLTATELIEHNRPSVQARFREREATITPVEPADIARLIVYVLTQPANVDIVEVLIRPRTSLP